MIAHKNSDSYIGIQTLMDASSAMSEINLSNSASTLRETSVQLEVSVGDLHEEIANLRSSVVDLQNAVAAMPVRSRGIPWTTQFYDLLVPTTIEGHGYSAWNILEWYDLILISAVVAVLSFVLGARNGGTIEPRDDQKLEAALSILLFGGYAVCVSSLLQWSKIRSLFYH